MRKSGKMASHNELGKEGENAAVKYLLEKGYEIRHRNWHSGHRDLDIVAHPPFHIAHIEDAFFPPVWN